MEMSVLTEQLMRFSDSVGSEIKRASAEFAAQAGTVEARIQALEWRTTYHRAAVWLAVRPQAYSALFDLVLTLSLLKVEHEKTWMLRFGEANRPMLEAVTRLEGAAWKLADEVLTDSELAMVRTFHQQWLAEAPGEAFVFDLSRMPSFEQLSLRQAAQRGLFTGITDLVTLDPLAGLEPATREVELVRRLGDRFFFYLQRLPTLLTSELELQLLRASQAAEVRGVLADIERFSRASEALAGTAAALPPAVGAELRLALEQASAELTVQREALVQDLEEARAPLVEVLERSQGTLEAGSEMSTALTAAIQALDAFVGRFQEPGVEQGEAPPSAGAEPAEPAGRPFDITEYGAAAAQIGAAAGELTAAIETLDRSLPEVQRVLDEAARRGEAAVDHATSRALLVLGVALVGGALVLLGTRWISRRWTGAPAPRME